jgi:hypothetical protein
LLLPRGARLDELGGNADGNLGGGLCTDGETDGGNHAGQIIVGETGLP